MQQSASASRTRLGEKVYVRTVPILSDNYSYLLVNEATKTAAVVDPAEPEKLIQAAKEENVAITAVLTTHHHWDHAGGNTRIAELIPGIEIVGSAYEPTPGATKSVSDQELYTIKGASPLRVRALAAACHTKGHLMYYVETDGVAPALFSGDTLFLAGCGRFFEGTAKDMHHIMTDVLGRLPKETLVFCGHEYTVSNLRFAAHVEPSNKAVSERLKTSQEQISQGKFTVPGRLGDEADTNPFMRSSVEDVIRATKVESRDPVSVMAALRQMKNDFK